MERSQTEGKKKKRKQPKCPTLQLLQLNFKLHFGGNKTKGLERAREHSISELDPLEIFFFFFAGTSRELNIAKLLEPEF